MTGQHDAPATPTDPTSRPDGPVTSAIDSEPHPPLKHLPHSLGVAFGCAVFVGLLGRLFSGQWQSMPAFLSTFLLIAAGCIPFTEWKSESESSQNGAGLGVMLGAAVGLVYGLMVSRFFQGVFFIGCIGTGVGWLMARYGVTRVPLPYTRDATMRTAAAISAAVLILHVTGILSSGGEKDLLPQSEVIATAKVNDTPGGEGQPSGRGPLEPHDIEAYCGLTQEAVKAKEWAMAIRFINEAIGCTPNNFKLHTTRAYVFKAHGLATKERELLTKAEGDLTSAIWIGSDNKQLLAEAYYERGCIRTDLLGEHTSAIDDFQKAHAAAPGHTPTAEGIARAKAALGRQQATATAAASAPSGVKTEPPAKSAPPAPVSPSSSDASPSQEREIAADDLVAMNPAAVSKSLPKRFVVVGRVIDIQQGEERGLFGMKKVYTVTLSGDAKGNQTLNSQGFVGRWVECKFTDNTGLEKIDSGMFVKIEGEYESNYRGAVAVLRKCRLAPTYHLR